MTARLLMRGQLSYLRRRGFEVGVAAAQGPELQELTEAEGVAVFPVPMSRKARPGKDLLALARLIQVIRRFKPHLVNAGTPKGGLLGMLAAWLQGVPVRIYTARGLRLETVNGAGRVLLRWVELLTCACAHSVVCVGESVRQIYLAQGLALPRKVKVVGPGSSNGVDLERFWPRQEADLTRLAKEIRIPSHAPVVGFVGRFTRDKGIEDLAAAFFDTVLPQHPEARLLLLGDFEAGDPVSEEVRQGLLDHPQVVCPGFVSDPAPYYALIDVVAFPSYREGFPNVPLEAAAAAVAVVGYRATGTVDAVQDGVTGTLCPTGDVSALAQGLCRYLADPGLRQRHGGAARERVESTFANERIWEAWAEEYEQLFQERVIVEGWRAQEDKL